MNYENCENYPLLTPTTPDEKVIEVCSTTPLHIGLGIGLNVLNIIENGAIDLDKSIKEDKGQYDAFETVYAQQREILSKYREVEDKANKHQENIDQIQENIDTIKTDRAIFFEKRNATTNKKNSDLAKGVRDHVAALGKEIESVKKSMAKVAKEQKKLENLLAKATEELNKIRGPFKRKFDDVLDSLHLQRVAYHSGSIVGPDVKKITRTKNIKAIGKVFSPIKLPGPDGEIKKYGSSELQAKFTTLLFKFQACYDLFTANRPLCRHEVELLALRCSSFGCWFPVNFPEESLKRKFHLLTVDVPHQARLLHTIGMITEQTIESIHPYINKLDRLFCTTQNKKDKALLIIKQHNLYSEPTLPKLK